jgi:hypothetical protein
MRQIRTVREELKTADAEFNDLQIQIAEAESQAERTREKLD